MVVKINWLSVPLSDAIGLDASTTTSPTRMVGAVRHERFDRNVAELARKPNQPAEDERLARHVLAGQILARVGLRIPLRDRAPQGGRKGRPPAQLAEQIAQRT